MTYWVFDDADAATMRVHRAECPHSATGSAPQGANDGVRGSWRGPYDDYGDAHIWATEVREYSDCPVCGPEVTYSLYADWAPGSAMTVIVHVAGCSRESESNCDHDPDWRDELAGVLHGPFDSYASVYDCINDTTDPLDAWAPAECTVCRPALTVPR